MLKRIIVFSLCIFNNFKCAFFFILDAAVLQHIGYSSYWLEVRRCDRETVSQGERSEDFLLKEEQDTTSATQTPIIDPYQLSLLQWKVFSDHLKFCAAEKSLPSFLTRFDGADCPQQKVDECFKIVELFRTKHADDVPSVSPDGAASKVGDSESCDSDADDDAEEGDVASKLHSQITMQNDRVQTWRWLLPFLLSVVYFVMLFFAATWHSDSAFPWEEDPASEFYTLTKDLIQDDLGLQDSENNSNMFVKTSALVGFLSSVSERWFWSEDASSAVRVGLIKLVLKTKKNGASLPAQFAAPSCSAPLDLSEMNKSCQSSSEGEIVSSILPFERQYLFAMGDSQKWQDVVDAQNASSVPLFESAELKFTLYSHAAKSLLHCHFHFRNVATRDISVNQKFTSLHSYFPWEDRQWYSWAMNTVFLPFIFCMSLIPYAAKGWRFKHSLSMSSSFLNSNDHLFLNEMKCEYIGKGAAHKDRRSLVLLKIAHSKFIKTSKFSKLFGWPEWVSFILIVLAFLFNAISRLKLGYVFQARFTPMIFSIC
jgi:hypothetical protein